MKRYEMEWNEMGWGGMGCQMEWHGIAYFRGTHILESLSPCPVAAAFGCTLRQSLAKLLLLANWRSVCFL